LRSSQPGRVTEYAEAGLRLLNEADESVWRMVGWDSLVLVKSNLALTEAAGLLRTDSAKVSGLRAAVAADLKYVSDAYALTRDKLLRRLPQAKGSAAGASRPSP
jgi:hypothetical protein